MNVYGHHRRRDRASPRIVENHEVTTVFIGLSRITGLLELGLEPHPITDDVVAEIIEAIIPHRDNIRTDQFVRGVKWD